MATAERSCTGPRTREACKDRRPSHPALAVHSHVVRTQGRERTEPLVWRRHARRTLQFCPSGKDSRCTTGPRTEHPLRRARCAPPPDPTTAAASAAAQAVLTARSAPWKGEGRALTSGPARQGDLSLRLLLRTRHRLSCRRASPLSGARPGLLLSNSSAMPGTELRTWRVPTVAERISRTSSFSKQKHSAR